MSVSTDISALYREFTDALTVVLGDALQTAFKNWYKASVAAAPGLVRLNDLRVVARKRGAETGSALKIGEISSVFGGVVVTDSYGLVIALTASVCAICATSSDG